MTPLRLAALLAALAHLTSAEGGTGNTDEAPPPLTFPGEPALLSGMTLLPILWDEPEGTSVTSYSVEYSIDGEHQETILVYYNTTYITVAVEMGDSPNCFTVTAHMLNDTDQVVGQGCTNTLPSAPLALKVAEILQNSAVLVWDPPEYPSGQLISFHVYYNGYSLLVPYNISMATANRFEIIGLEPDTAYLINVTAENTKGEGPPSDPILLQTTANSYGDWRMYVAVAAVGGFLVGIVFATCVACAATGSRAAAKALKAQRDQRKRPLTEQEED